MHRRLVCVKSFVTDAMAEVYSSFIQVVTGAIDVWALGVVAYQLLTGSDALSAMSAEDLFHALQPHGKGKMPWEKDMSFAIARPFAMYALPVNDVI